MKPYRLSLHIFRRDLRLVDNTALNEALETSDQVIPCFIFDERQVNSNDYKSDNCLQFMGQSLVELDTALQKQQSHLYCFFGIAEKVVAELLTNYAIDAVYLNRDYTPFSRTRDQAIANVCKKLQRAYICQDDALLHAPEEVLKSNQQPYTVFTHAYRYAQTLPVRSSQKMSHGKFYASPHPEENKELLNKYKKANNPNLITKGGRKEALTLLSNIPLLTDYATLRNIPIAEHTTHLSAHHKFGTVSIREVYTVTADCFGKDHSLIAELHWRDFFTHIAYWYPQVFGNPFNKKYTDITWSTNENHFRAWCEGFTGFPIVDAGMRELNTTGFMHNRVRMIVASFLTKDLHIDWRWGEKYFAQHLTDYDPAVNNGNWQWAASTGCDAQPYFRIFNPWLQQKKFDPECLYIKRWIPELAKLTPPIIHQPEKNMKDYLTNYPNPIIDHAIESQKSKMLYSSLK